MDKLKVLHITLHLNIGGREKLIVGLCNQLNHYGHFSAIACLKHTGVLAEQLIDKTEVKEYYKKEALDFSIIKKLRKYIIRRNFDIIHCHNPGTLLYGYLAGKLAGNKPIINTEHGFVSKNSLLGDIKDRSLYHLVDRITVVSGKLRYDLLNKYRVSPNKIIVVNNAIEPIAIDESKDHSRLKIGLNVEDYYIGIVARLTKIKNHQLLLDSMKILLNKKIDAKLIIVGSGEERKDLEKYVYDNGLSNNVLFMGDRKDIPVILNAIDLFVLSSDSEGLSMAILEAMSAGLPIVATDVGGNKELIKDMVNGILIQPNCAKSLAEAILRLLENRKLADKMGESGKNIFYDRFTIEKMTEKMVGVYFQYLDKNVKLVCHS